MNPIVSSGSGISINSIIFPNSIQQNPGRADYYPGQSHKNHHGYPGSVNFMYNCNQTNNLMGDANFVNIKAENVIILPANLNLNVNLNMNGLAQAYADKFSAQQNYENVGGEDSSILDERKPRLNRIDLG